MGIVKRFIKNNNIVQEYLSRGNLLPIIEVEDVLEKMRLIERKRIIKIIKSHIEPTYPINCKSIIQEINGTTPKETNGNSN